MWINLATYYSEKLLNSWKQSPIITTVFQDDLTLSLPVLLLVSVIMSLLLEVVVVAVVVVVIVEECSVRTW